MGFQLCKPNTVSHSLQRVDLLTILSTNVRIFATFELTNMKILSWFNSKSFSLKNDVWSWEMPLLVSLFCKRSQHESGSSNFYQVSIQTKDRVWNCPRDSIKNIRQTIKNSRIDHPPMCNRTKLKFNPYTRNHTILGDHIISCNFFTRICIFGVVKSIYPAILYFQ